MSSQNGLERYGLEVKTTKRKRCALKEPKRMTRRFKDTCLEEFGVTFEAKAPRTRVVGPSNTGIMTERTVKRIAKIMKEERHLGSPKEPINTQFRCGEVSRIFRNRHQRH